jgi:hypothetical protein
MTTPEPSPAPPPPAPPTVPAPPKKQRWKKVLLVTGGVFAGLILVILITGPFIIGAVAKSQIVSIVEEKLQAKASVGSVSFSWSGHIQVDDVRLVPKNFRDPLVEVKKVDVNVSLGSAIGGSYIADVEVVAPKIIVEKGADGKFNYEFPPQPAKESRKAGEKAADKNPFVQANVRIRDGEVRIRGGGRETVYRNLAVDAKVDTLDKPITYAVSLDTVKVTGGFDLNTRSGPATLVLDRFSLRNATGAARAYSDILELDGTISGSLDYQIKGAPRFAGKGRLEIADFRMDQTLLDRVTVTHDGAIDDKGSGRHVLTISSGKAIDSTLTLDVIDAFGARIVKTDVKADLDLAALADLLRGKLPKGMALAGAISVRGTCDSRGPTQADLDAGKLRVGARVDITIAAKNLDITMDGKPMKLDAVTVHHVGTLSENGSGKNSITIDSGKALSVQAQVDVTDALGKTPAVAADLAGSSDLGALGALLEKLIGMKPGMALEGAATLKGKVQAQGADLAKADLGVTLANVVAVDTKTKKRYDVDQAVELKLTGGWNGKTKTATAEAIKLTSSFATMDGKGGAAIGGELPEIKESTFKLDADLEKLGAKLALFMEDAPVLRGTIAATASYAGDRYDLDATVQHVTIRTEKKVREDGRDVIKTDTTGPIDATISQKGVLSLAKGGGFRIETGVVKSSAVDLKLTGEIRNVMEESREGEIRLEAALRPEELSKWVSNLDMGGPEINARVLVAIQKKTFAVTGQTQLAGLTMKGETSTRTVKTGPVDFLLTKTDPILVAVVTAPMVEWLDKGLSAKGALESRLSQTGKDVVGTTKLSNLEVTDEKKNVVKDPGLTIVHDVELADQNKTIDLKKVEVSSSFLRGTITGRILRLDPALEFQKVHLAFKYLPTKLGAVAKPWLPGKLEGTEEKVLDITLDGKAASSKVLAILRGTTGAIDVDLATFTMDGLSVTGRTRLDLKDGKLVSGTPLSVNKGKTDLNASLDFGPPEKKPQSTLTFNAREVDANGQMGPLLERINPIFHTSGVDAKVDGQIQSDFKMIWTGPIDPDEKDWVAAASRSLSGSGLFSVQNLNILGSPAVGQIMSAIGQDKNALQGEVIATTIRIANGRCEYENMLLRGGRKDPSVLQRDQEQLALDRQQLEAEKDKLSPREYQNRVVELKVREDDLPFRYTLKFTGWVGFDKKMQLRVLMPMTQNMAKSHASLTKYIGTSFWVDLTGTTESPRLDLNKMLSEAVKRAAEGVVMDKLDDALKKLFDKKKKDEKK